MSMEHQNAPHQWNEETIDLSEIYFLFRQRIKWIVVALVAGAVAAAIITLFFITPLYRATASLYVVSASNDSVVDLSDLQIGASLTADYEILLLSRPMMESVIQNLALEDATVESLSKQITITNPSDTRILQITVEDKDPELAICAASSGSLSFRSLWRIRIRNWRRRSPMRWPIWASPGCRRSWTLRRRTLPKTRWLR